MFRRLFVFILLTTLWATVSFAQDAPKSEGVQGGRNFYRIALGESGGYLGVELKEVSNSNYQQLGLTSVRGVAVDRVLKDTPAEKAGLKNGDVIVKFNGESVTSVRKLTRMIGEVAPDHTVNLTVVRNGGEIEIPVTVGERKGFSFARGEFEFPMPPVPPDAPDGVLMPPTPPDAPDAPNAPMFPKMPRIPGVPDVRVFPDGDVQVFGFISGRQMGMGTISLTKQLGEFFGVENGKGLLITSVAESGPAATAGLKAGDVIVEVDGKEVKNQMDLFRGSGRDSGEPVVLTIVRDRTRKTVSVTPEARKDGDLFRGYEFRTREKESN